MRVVWVAAASPFVEPAVIEVVRAVDANDRRVAGVRAVERARHARRSEHADRRRPRPVERARGGVEDVVARDSAAPPHAVLAVVHHRGRVVVRAAREHHGVAAARRRDGGGNRAQPAVGPRVGLAGVGGPRVGHGPRVRVAGVGLGEVPPGVGHGSGVGAARVGCAGVAGHHHGAAVSHHRGAAAEQAGERQRPARAAAGRRAGRSQQDGPVHTRPANSSRAMWACHPTCVGAVASRRRNAFAADCFSALGLRERARHRGRAMVLRVDRSV